MSPMVLTAVSFADRGVGDSGVVRALLEPVAFCARGAPGFVETVFGAFPVAGFLTLVLTAAFCLLRDAFLVALAFFSVDCLTSGFFNGFVAALDLFPAGLAPRFAAAFGALGLLIVFLVGMTRSLACTCRHYPLKGSSRVHTRSMWMMSTDAYSENDLSRADA